MIVLVLVRALGSQLHWLYTGFQLEFMGLPVCVHMWVGGLLFFVANMLLLCVVLANHRFQPVFFRGICTAITTATPAATTTAASMTSSSELKPSASASISAAATAAHKKQ